MYSLCMAEVTHCKLLSNGAEVEINHALSLHVTRAVGGMWGSKEGKKAIHSHSRNLACQKIERSRYWPL